MRLDESYRRDLSEDVDSDDASYHRYTFGITNQGLAHPETCGRARWVRSGFFAL